MLGARELGLIRDGGVFVNVSRGQIVDSDALIAELQAERIVACLDVFDPEPVPDDSPIRELLRSPDFLRLWLVGAFANAMRWLELLASGLFAWEATHSAFAVTVVVALRQIPQLLFGAFAGALSEALNRKLIFMLALSCRRCLDLARHTGLHGPPRVRHVALGNPLWDLWSTERRRAAVSAGRGPASHRERHRSRQRHSAATRAVGPGWAAWRSEGCMKGAYASPPRAARLCLAIAGFHAQTRRLTARIRRYRRGRCLDRAHHLLVFSTSSPTPAFHPPLARWPGRVPRPTGAGRPARGRAIKRLVGGADRGGSLSMDRRPPLPAAPLFMVASSSWRCPVLLAGLRAFVLGARRASATCNRP
jgi:hypothetical protein